MKRALLVLLALILTCYACNRQENTREVVSKRMDFGIPSRADTLMLDAFNTNDWAHIAAVIDSLEQTGDFSAVGANFNRGRMYMYQEKHAMASEYFRQVVCSKDIDERSFKYYYPSVNYLGTELYRVGDYEGALRVAAPVVAMMDSLDNGNIDYQINLRSLIGCCFLNLGQLEQAKESFNRSCAYCHELLANDTTQGALQKFINNNGRIYNAYVDIKDWEDALTWVECNDTLLEVFERRYKDVASYVVEIYNGYAALNHAIVLQGLGREAEAATYYDKHLTFNCAKSTDARIHAVDYLMAAHRYGEAADNLTSLDQLIPNPDLNDIGAYFLPKFQANYFVGNTDTALLVANRIAQAYDSALSDQKKNQMAELAMIYDTQGKQMQIARQQSELSTQRFIGTGIALVLLTVFFIIYIWYRRRAQKRLAVAHEQLENAHTELLSAYSQLEETTTAKERIESELRIARDIQMSMVPGIFPKCEGLDMYAEMNPAKEVGGDLYGYVLIDQCLYFCLGDVSGKGVPASLFMSQSARLFRTLATENLSPVDIAIRMNNELAENNERGMFVTMFIGMVHLDTGRLDFCNCGHNPPVIDGEFLKMEYDNQPLGLWEDDPFFGETIDDIRGSQLLIYTDGLNEAENRQQELLGNERLLELMADTRSMTSHEVIDMLKAAVEQHRDGADPNDDLTLMCIQLRR